MSKHAPPRPDPRLPSALLVGALTLGTVAFYFGAVSVGDGITAAATEQLDTTDPTPEPHPNRGPYERAVIPTIGVLAPEPAQSPVDVPASVREVSTPADVSEALSEALVATQAVTTEAPTVVVVDTPAPVGNVGAGSPPPSTTQPEPAPTTTTAPAVTTTQEPPPSPTTTTTSEPATTTAEATPEPTATAEVTVDVIPNVRTSRWPHR